MKKKTIIVIQLFEFFFNKTNSEYLYYLVKNNLTCSGRLKINIYYLKVSFFQQIQHALYYLKIIKIKNKNKKKIKGW